MHTTVEMVAIKDVESVIQLILATLRALTPKTSFKYL
jgi:putative aminopeptidase FrvX